MDLPHGFEPLVRASPVSELIGPVYSKGVGANFIIGLRVSEKLCNIRGTMHGGMVATVADMALGYALAWTSQPPTPMVTASLTIDYAGTAEVGDWIESRVDIQKKGAKLAFANCYIVKGEQRIAHASGVFFRL
jgi:acyl-coenzyme A thioesterase PaaI-like protein